MWMVRWLLVAALLIVLLGFSLLNLDQRVSIDVVVAHWDDLPLLLVLFETFIAGMLLWFVISFATVARLQKELRGLRRERDRSDESAGEPFGRSPGQDRAHRSVGDGEEDEDDDTRM
jgi:uncharacterized integral membrane protein